MTDNILKPEDKYSGVSSLPQLIENASSQRELVEKLMEYSPSFETQGVSEFSNPGISFEGSFQDQETLETSIFLALASNKKTQSLVLRCSDTPVKSKRIVVPGSISDMSRKKLATFLATAMLQDTRSIGFSLGFKYSGKNPSGYEASLYIPIDKDLDREALKAKGLAEIEEKTNILMADVKDSVDKDGNYTVGYKELAQRKQDIIDESTTWNPTYILQY